MPVRGEYENNLISRSRAGENRATSMKKKWFQYLRGVTPALLLLTVLLPFAAMAQDRTASADSKEITLTIEGTIQGGRFFFKERTIQFDNMNKYDWPTRDILVNGKPWNDFSKPFELDYTPDFAKAVILEKEGGPKGSTYVLNREKLFALMIVPSKKDPEEAPFRVRLAVKNLAEHKDLPPDETPSGGGAPKRASVIAARRVQNSSSAVNERLALVFEGEIKGKGRFRLLSNRIEYHPAIPGVDDVSVDSRTSPSYPENVTVNGKPWDDLHNPFYLDFVTDYATGKLTDRSGEAAISWRALPVGDSIFDRFERTVGELVIVGEGKDDASPFQAAITLEKLPQDYAARMIAILNDDLEKRRKGNLDGVYMTNPDLLTPEELEEVEQWREERRRDQLAWTSERNYTTDGKDLPFLRMTVADPGPRVSSPDRFDVTVEAVVNCSAVFAFLGDKIIYSDQSYPNAGKYPRQVKINGNAWRNLHQPFTLESEINPDSVIGINVETEYYRYYLSPERNRIALGIVNHGPRDEEHIRIRLSLRKKNAAPANRK